jgi:hypothetical protein
VLLLPESEVPFPVSVVSEAEESRRQQVAEQAQCLASLEATALSPAEIDLLAESLQGSSSLQSSDSSGLLCDGQDDWSGQALLGNLGCATAQMTLMTPTTQTGCRAVLRTGCVSGQAYSYQLWLCQGGRQGLGVGELMTTRV